MANVTSEIGLLAVMRFRMFPVQIITVRVTNPTMSFVVKYGLNGILSISF
jgi:hypothetical protein